ncbi:Activating molecule in BN1-regulated autophagy protein, variant 2 [Homalodisca vitripennis]|nr:Activating molecule in BN1-regulated autophagy protein, variant 2 [Homalodisca vitripennis]
MSLVMFVFVEFLCLEKCRGKTRKYNKATNQLNGRRDSAITLSTRPLDFDLCLRMGRGQIMEDKGLDFSKPPPEPENPPVNRSVPRCFQLRETGFKNKTNTVPKELQWAAEDKMVMRSHEEFRCQLPDVSRSTFLMVFSPDGKKVASTHGNHNVYVTDLTSGKNIKTLTGHPRTPWCIAFHPSSNHILASGCLGGQVRVWDLSVSLLRYSSTISIFFIYLGIRLSELWFSTLCSQMISCPISLLLNYSMNILYWLVCKYVSIYCDFLYQCLTFI